MTERMPQSAVYNFKGERVGQTELSSKVFAVPVVADTIHQVVVAELANARHPIAHTKTRGEVRGGGRKPWRQKGTGQARAGSIRSPLWRKGGVTFGPRSGRNFTKHVNRSMFRKAVAMVFSQKFQHGQVATVDSLPTDVRKTKDLQQRLLALRTGAGLPAKKLAVIMGSSDRRLQLAARNVPEVEFLQLKDVSPYRLLKAHGIIISTDALSQLVRWLSK